MRVRSLYSKFVTTLMEAELARKLETTVLEDDPYVKSIKKKESEDPFSAIKPIKIRKHRAKFPKNPRW